MRVTSAGRASSSILLALLLASGPARAEVVATRVTSERTIVVPGPGGAERYVYFTGVARGEIEPREAAWITGIERAPRNERGRVTYETEFAFLRPAVLQPGRQKLLVEITNRGRKFLLPWVHGVAVRSPALNAPASAADLGDRFVLRQGHAVLWFGWDGSSTGEDGSLRVQLPVLEGEEGQVREEFSPGVRNATTSAGFSLTAPYAPGGESAAVLSVVRDRRSPGEPVPRSAWTFSDPLHLYLNPAQLPVESGVIYSLVYRARSPKLMGLGYSVAQDVIAYFRAGQDPEGRSAVTGFPPGRAYDLVLAFGISQSGRFLHDFLRLRLNAGKAGRLVDGMLIYTAGAGGVFANELFAQPFRTRTAREDRAYPEARFPFAYARATDPATGRPGALFAFDGTDPKVMEVDTASEYWQKQAALIHTTPEGVDLPLPEDVRMYLLAGLSHEGRPGFRPSRGLCRYPANVASPTPVLRALLVALERWAAEGKAPPVSRVPRVSNGTLVGASAFRGAAFPEVPEPVPLELDGDWVTGRPPGRTVPALVPQVDALGQELAGVKLPEIAVPLGASTGWNVYADSAAGGAMCDRRGAFFAYPDRMVRRLYPSKRVYMARLERALDALVRARLLLPEDRPALLKEAGERAPATGG